MSPYNNEDASFFSDLTCSTQDQFSFLNDIVTKASPFRPKYLREESKPVPTSASHIQSPSNKKRKRGSRKKKEMDEEDEKLCLDLMSPLLDSSSPRHERSGVHPGSPLFENELRESAGKKMLEDMIFTTPPRKPPKHQSNQSSSPPSEHSSDALSTPTPPPLKSSLQSPYREEEVVGQIKVFDSSSPSNPHQIPTPKDLTPNPVLSPSSKLPTPTMLEDEDEEEDDLCSIPDIKPPSSQRKTTPLRMKSLSKKKKKERERKFGRKEEEEGFQDKISMDSLQPLISSSKQSKHQFHIYSRGLSRGEEGEDLTPDYKVAIPLESFQTPPPKEHIKPSTTQTRNNDHLSTPIIGPETITPSQDDRVTTSERRRRRRINKKNLGDEWKIAISPDGNQYFYNQRTKESRWKFVVFLSCCC